MRVLTEVTYAYENALTIVDNEEEEKVNIISHTK